MNAVATGAFDEGQLASAGADIGEKGGPLRAPNFRRVAGWEDACQEAGLPKGFHFHDLRHRGNLMAAEAGASTRELMHRLGQSTIWVALIYQHATAKRNHEIADAIDRRLARESNHDNEDPDDDDDDGLAGVVARVR